MKRALLPALALVLACGGGQARPDYPTPDDEPALRRRATVGTTPETTSRDRVTRAELDSALAAGPGALLSHVKVEAASVNRRFKGWQLVSLPAQPWLRPGDVVTRINGRGLEHPEDLAALFEALRGAREIVVEYERGGVAAVEHIPIVE